MDIDIDILLAMIFFSFVWLLLSLDLLYPSSWTNCILLPAVSSWKGNGLVNFENS